MKNVLMLSAVVMLLAGSATAGTITFDSPSDLANFNQVQGPSVTLTQLAGTGTNNVAIGNNVLSMPVSFGQLDSCFAYTPAGSISAAGTGTVTVDVRVNGVSDNSWASGGLMLQFLGSQQMYEVRAAEYYGAFYPEIGCSKGNSNDQDASGHTTSLENGANPTMPGDPSGWMHLTAVVGTDGSGHYKIVATYQPESAPGVLTGSPVSYTYIDTGANNNTGAFQVGLMAGGYAVNNPVYFDNYTA